MELYAVKYGENYKYGNYQTVYRNHKSTELVPGFIFLIYIVKYKNKILLFDTGFRSPESAEFYGVDLIDVEREMDTILDGKKIDTIFITHAHFDHIDNLDLYPETDIIISKSEHESALNKCSEKVKHILKSDYVHIVQEEYDYDHKFLFKVIGGHTEGSSVIYFEHEGKEYVIAGDECYSIDNVTENIPNGMVSNGEKNEAFIADAHNRALITLPYHDDKVFLGYEKVTEHIVRII